MHACNCAFDFLVSTCIRTPTSCAQNWWVYDEKLGGLSNMVNGYYAILIISGQGFERFAELERSSARLHASITLPTAGVLL